MKRIESLFATVAATALFTMMWLTVVDVVGRKFFNNSLTGAVELTELVMLITIFVALPLTSRAGEHIVFDLLDRVLPARYVRWQRVWSQAVTALVVGGAAFIVVQRALRTFEYGDTTAQLEIPLGGFHLLVGVMLAITALVHLALMWREMVNGGRSRS